jgi:hypothetical protein
MQVIISNKSRLGRVVFNKIAKIGTISLSQVSDVVTTGQQDGDVLVYQANTDTYNIKTLPEIDGGLF